MTSYFALVGWGTLEWLSGCQANMNGFFKTDNVKPLKDTMLTMLHLQRVRQSGWQNTISKH